MMFIITDRNPDKAVQFLVENTSKTFYFKQLIELAQLICSAGFSHVYKRVNRGKEIQDWIRHNKWFTSQYFRRLWFYCMATTNIKHETSYKISKILYALEDTIDNCRKPTTCVFRYKKGYDTDVPSNTELPIGKGVEEYRKYILEYKFKNV